jgi:antitoxin ParD1/3/4
MAIHLNKDLEAEIDRRVRSGAYRSADDLIREGLELINAREELRQAIAAGAAQLDRGEGIPGEQVFEELRARSRELRSKAK